MIVQRYPEPFIAPMRAELTRLGFDELRTPESVDQAVERTGTTMIVVNSVCGCAAGKARPGVAMALRHDKKPARVANADRFPEWKPGNEFKAKRDEMLKK